MNDCTEIAPLLSGLLDNELSAEESKRINDHLIRCAACRAEYERLRKESSQLDTLSIREPQDEALAKFWRLPYSGLARNAGLILLIGGYLCFLGYSIVQFMSDESEWLFGKLTVAAILAGGLIVFGIVVIERIISYRSDPYKEVER